MLYLQYVVMKQMLLESAGAYWDAFGEFCDKYFSANKEHQ